MKLLILSIVMTLAAVLFALANSHRVEVSVIFGAPIQIRLIFLLGTAFLTGAAVPCFFFLVRRVRVQRAARRAGQDRLPSADEPVAVLGAGRLAEPSAGHLLPAYAPPRNGSQGLPVEARGFRDRRTVGC